MRVYRIETRDQKGPFANPSCQTLVWRDYTAPKSSISERPYKIVQKYNEPKYGFSDKGHLYNYFSRYELNKLSRLGYLLAEIEVEEHPYLDSFHLGEDQMVFDNIHRLNTKYEEIR